MRNPSTTNISDQLAVIDWAYDQWLNSSDNPELNQYLGDLLIVFARSNNPAVLTEAEYDHFMTISRDLCHSGTDDTFNS